MLVDWLACRALDKRLEAHIERAYREIVDGLAVGERDPAELETTLAARYHPPDAQGLTLTPCQTGSS